MNSQLLISTPNDRRQYVAFGILTLSVAGLTGILYLSPGTITNPYLGIIPVNPVGFFKPFIGESNPLLAIALVAVVGFVSLGFLYARGWFEIYSQRGNLRGLVVAAIAATLFGMEIISAEITNLIRLPTDMNVPPPWSLLFYPVIAYVVEVLFHALPLALLLIILGTIFKKSNTNHLVWLCIFIVASLEPLFQTNIGSLERPFSFTKAYAGLHVFAINLAQLYVFRRYGFISMYSFRLFYYMYWHILWGYVRLQWLF